MTKKLLLSVPIILIIGVLLIAAVFAAGIAGSEKTAGAVNFPDGQQGNGTSENPYIISDYSDLVTLSQLIAQETDSHYAEAYYAVTVKSITITADATGGQTFIPIGSETNPFTGNFEGNGVIISGLTVDSDDDYVGLFGYVGEGAVISEVGLYKADIATNYYYAGGIAGYNEGKISSCFVHGSISGLQRVGGIAGCNAGVIENCYSSGAIVPPPGSVAISHAGGLVGEIAAGGALRYSYTFAEVEAEESSESAGAVAGSSAGEITRCYTVAVANADKELAPIGTGSGNAYSYNGQNIANSQISALFNNIVAANWVRVSGYTAGNGVSFAGPVLSVFYNEVAAGDDRDAILYDVFTFRYFSIGNNASYATWGSAENPYLIGSAAELKTLSALTSGLNGNDTGIGAQSFAGKYFALSKDILSAGDSDPIGTAGTPFSGYFSGNDHTIEGLNINTGADDTGMFGYLVGATVTNLHIDAAYVFGNAYIGIVAGRAIDSTVSNIVITNSTLSAVSNAGGIVGMTQNGAIRSVYVQAQLTGRDASIPNADVGTVQGSPPQSDGNVWYVGNNVSRAHTYSSMIYVADPASDVDVSFDTVQGSYEFTLNANPAAGADVEFRTVDETVVLKGETVSFSLNQLKTAGADYGVTVFYLRFVHSVSIRLTTAGGTGNTNFEMNAYFEAEGNPDQISLYDGQTARFVVSNLLTTNFREFRYISAVGTNNSDTEISLSSASNNNNPVLYGRFVMNETLTEITLTVEHLAMPDNYSSVLNKTYDGTPVEYDENYLSNLPAAIRSNVRYSTGTAPKNAGTYSVITEIVGNGGNYNGIIFGAMSTEFTIARHQLTYNPTADTAHRPVIEWGSNGMINLSIAAADLAESEIGFDYIDGDDLTVNAVVTFDSAALSTVGEGKSVSYSLSLSGTAAVNYELSSSTVSNVAVGEVTKREIYITPSSVEKVYDGRAPMLTTYNLSRTIDRIYSASDSITYKVPAIVTDNLAITFTPQADGQEPGDAGIYVLTIEFKDDAGKGKFTWDANIGFADVYDLKIEAIPHSGVLVAGDKGIDYVINRRLLSVDYVLTSDGKEYPEGATVSYNATPYKPVVTGFETAENGALTSISVKVDGVTADGNEITGESEVTVAGRYLLRIDYDTSDSVYKNYVFEEYEFEILKAVPTAALADGTDYVYSTEGVEVNLSSDVVLSYPGEQTLHVEYFSDEIGSADDYILTLKNAGDFPITVVIEGDGNRADAEIRITVTVARRPVTVSATAVEADYGEKPKYAFEVTDTYGNSVGQAEEIKFDDLGIDLNDLTVGTSAGKEFPDVGTYDIILSGDVSAAVNYDITLTETNTDALTVVPKKLYIKWENNMSAVYGAALNIPYTAVDDTGNDLSQSPLVGKLVLGTMSADGFTPAEVNEFGRIDTGTYSIGWTTEFAEANSNYELSRFEESGGYKYQINKAVFGVKVDSNTKVYGETDPDPVWSFINVFEEEVHTLKNIYTVTVGRVGGEDAYQTVDGNTVSPATYRYYTERVVINSGVMLVNNYEYSSPLSEFGSLSITRRAPNVTVNSDSAIEPNVPLSDSVSINASAFDMNGIQISGVFSWGENIGTIPDFSDSDTVSVTAVFAPDYDNADNLNYSETEFVVNVAVLPIVIDIAWGANKYVYSGKATPDMVYTATAAGENVLLTLTYEGDRVNVGSYTVTASINDNNYRLPENASVEVEIVPATVTVSFGSQSYEIVEGDEFTPTVKYEGFVNGETEEVLTRRAEYDTYTLPGSYSLELSGARADNYTFVYVDSTLTIYRAELTDEDFGATFEGAFPEEVTLTITASDDLQTGNAQNLFNIVKGAYTSLSDKVLRSVYSLNYAGIDGYVNKGDISVTMPAPEFGSAETLQFIYVTNEGDVVVIDNATYGEDGSVTLTMTDAAYILVSVTDDSGLADYTLYMVIGGVVVVLILMILIGIAIKRRRDRRIIKYEDE